MSEGIFRCHTFLALIAIVFYVEALINESWRYNFIDRHCSWKHIDNDKYELINQANSTHSRHYAYLSTAYRLEESDFRPGEFCIVYSAYHVHNAKLILRINSDEFTIRGGVDKRECIAYNDFIQFKVTFNATCHHYGSHEPKVNLRLEIKTAVLEPVTPSPTENGDPTSDVGDIQYVGVVVGAICIALFTLFSCLTIVSARRSNQRESRRRTIPSASCQDEDDNRPDVVADNAPPSYDAVMACPDLYPPTPQDTPHGTPDTTPHLSLHRRALLNQHMGSLGAGSASASPQLQRQSFTSTLASDDMEEIPEYPPPPYPGLANGDVSIAIPEDSTDNTTELAKAPEGTPGVNNPAVSTSASDDDSMPSSPDQNSSLPGGGGENPWVLNNAANSHLRNRDNNPIVENTLEQHPMQERTRDGDSTPSNEDSRDGSTRSNSPVDEPKESSHDDRVPKPIVESGTPSISVRVAVV